MGFIVDLDEDPCLPLPPRRRPQVEHQVIDRSKRLTVYRMLADGNDTVPVGRLPDAVLHRVFWFLTGSPPGWHHRTPCRLGWLAVSHVCFRWRRLALASPDLWTHVFLPTHPDAVKATLIRSHDRPLNVTFAFIDTPQSLWPAHYPPETIRLVFQNMHRVKALAMLQFVPALQACMDSLPAHADQLSAFYGATPHTTLFLSRLTGMSALRVVELNSVPVSFWKHCGAWPLLQKLRVESVARGTAMADILGGLCSLRSLLLLHLPCSFLVPRGSTTYPTPALHRLHAIELVGDLDNAASLLAHLRLGPFTRLFVDPRGTVQLTDNLSETMGKLCVVLTGLINNSVPPVLSLQLQNTGHNHFSLSGWTNDQLADGAAWQGSTHGLKFGLRMPALAPSIHELIVNLPLARVRSVRIADVNFADLGFLGGLVGLLREGSLRNIRALEVCDVNFAWFDGVLLFDAEGGRARCPLQKLKTLVVISESQEGCIHVLCVALQARQSVGMPLPEVKLSPLQIEHTPQHVLDALPAKIEPSPAA
ncbi:hypothetical protein PHLGIDRAFT_119441 [Phlebiopsis gigantea 11061_1 CR5-6]|uniref:Uncharacterized protein n=1 Tax=Phlebiopsis gigantea (strain 11061_1 CR5-6) TaxID=745531 RepID=A0A0C3PIQ2_PHLG1|nr:hypothetical protein PHLGIDRAFT_119441 [Phlebiopsis gigantea 11061_1 CR5-6]